jgi:hypothetical protein
MKATNFDELNHIGKLQAFGALQRQNELNELENPLFQQSKELARIIWISDSIQIGERREDKYYRNAYPDVEKWFVAIVGGKVTSHLHESEEAAFLFALGYKYDAGANTQFHHFAARMLPGFIVEPDKI